MASAASRIQHRTMSADSAFGRAFGTIFHNPLVTLGLAFLFGAVPALLSNYAITIVRSDTLRNVAPGHAPASLQNQLYLFYGLTIFSWVLDLIIIALTQAVLTRATVAESEDQRAGFGECISAGFRVLLPLIGLMILLALAVMAGFILLIVPGVMLYVMWSVATPALVEERIGVFRAFGRSRELTKGARWKVFGILLVVAVVNWLISAMSTFGMMFAGGFSAAALAARGEISLSFIIVSLVASTITNVLWGVMQASLYVELRQWKEGGSVETLEQVFA